MGEGGDLDASGSILAGSTRCCFFPVLVLGGGQGAFPLSQVDGAPVA